MDKISQTTLNRRSQNKSGDYATPFILSSLINITNHNIKGQEKLLLVWDSNGEGS